MFDIVCKWLLRLELLPRCQVRGCFKCPWIKQLVHLRKVFQMLETLVLGISRDGGCKLSSTEALVVFQE